MDLGSSRKNMAAKILRLSFMSIIGLRLINIVGRKTIKLVGSLLALGFIVSCSLWQYQENSVRDLAQTTELNHPTYDSLPPTGSPPHEIPPGLNSLERGDYYHLSEGADLYPYDWLVALKSVGFKKDEGMGQNFLEDLDKKFGVIKSENNTGSNEREYLIPWVGLSTSWSDNSPDKSDAYKGDDGQFPVYQGESNNDKLMYREIEIEGKRVKSIRLTGTNCSFCHTAELEYRGKKFRFDAGPNMLNVRDFFQDMLKSTVAVMANEEIGTNFLKALNVPNAANKASQIRSFFFKELGESSHGFIDAGKLSGLITLLFAKLFNDRERLFRGHEAIGKSFEKLLRITYGFKDDDDIGVLKMRMNYLGTMAVGTNPKLHETTSGFGRTDAFGRIGNLVLRGDHPIDITGPVSYPWIWGIKYMAFLHYNANTNSVILRNVGQSLGLGAMITNDKLDSTVNINNLSRLENLTHKTTYPQWKVAFGDIPELAINTESANRGKVIYEKQCQICHDSQDFVGPRKNLRNYQVTSLEHLGTDPFAAQNAVKPIHGQSRLIPFQDKILSDVSGVKRRFYERYQIDEEQQSTNEFFAIRGGEFFRDTLVGFKQNDPAIGYGDIEAGSGYKARHLSSVWATGPFLHNGSVPTLWELLLPAKHRPKTFRVRSREFDAERVGISTVRDCDTKEPDCFNTAGSDSDGSPIAGNTNVGHEFGAIDTKYGKALLDQEKKDLIEYLKVLPPNDEYSWQDSSY